jgi:hypothetical protein
MPGLGGPCPRQLSGPYRTLLDQRGRADRTASWRHRRRTGLRLPAAQPCGRRARLRSSQPSRSGSLRLRSRPAPSPLVQERRRTRHPRVLPRTRGPRRGHYPILPSLRSTRQVVRRRNVAAPSARLASMIPTSTTMSVGFAGAERCRASRLDERVVGVCEWQCPRGGLEGPGHLFAGHCSSWTSVDVAARAARSVCAFGRPARRSNAVAIAASRSRVECW